jgi:hypothetical protein
MDLLKFSFEPEATKQVDKLSQLIDTTKAIARGTTRGGCYAHVDEYRLIPITLLNQLRKNLADLGIKP